MINYRKYFWTSSLKHDFLLWWNCNKCFVLTFVYEYVTSNQYKQLYVTLICLFWACWYQRAFLVIKSLITTQEVYNSKPFSSLNAYIVSDSTLESPVRLNLDFNYNYIHFIFQHFTFLLISTILTIVFFSTTHYVNLWLNQNTNYCRNVFRGNLKMYCQKKSRLISVFQHKIRFRILLVSRRKLSAVHNGNFSLKKQM